MSSGKKRILKKIYISLFVSMISLPWIVWGGVRIFAPDYFAEQSDLSKEKRNKNEFKLSDLIDSGEGLSSYIDDRVPFRGGFISIYQTYDGKTEKVYQDAMRSVISFFSGKGPERKEVGKLDSMFGGDSSGSGVSDNEPTQEITEGKNHEHSLYVAEIEKPECEKSGYILYKCRECEYTQKDITPPKGHDFMLIKESEVSYDSYGYKAYICKECGKFEVRDLVSKYVDTTYMAPQIVGGTLLGRDNWMYYADNNAMDYYTGINVLTEEQMKSYADKVNRLQELCNARGKSLVIMFMPNKEQVYPEYMPTMEVYNQYKRVQQLTDYLSANTYTSCLYPLEALKTAEIFWPVYYKYDSHWNHMGAFVGLQEMYKVLGIETTNPMLLGAPVCPTDRNDLLLLGGLSPDNYNNDSEFVPNYKNDIYVDGLDVHADICHTYSSSPNACKLVMLADSFREMMTPYITKDFSECVIAHRNVTDSVAEDIQNCNILVIAAVEREDTSLFSCIDKVIAILEQQ